MALLSDGLLFVYFETYGCSANQNNSEIMQGLVESSGLKITNNPQLADILVLNTCVVKGPTQNKMNGRIRELSGLGKPLIVAGCMPNAYSKSRIKESSDNDDIYLLGVRDSGKINELIRSIAENKGVDYLSRNNEVKLMKPKKYVRKHTGITQISEGCDGNCTYCITKVAKGKLFSYPKQKILDNIKKDLAAGCKEVWITSQDNASYGLDVDGRYHLVDLLNSIVAIPGNFRVRLGMMNPNHVLKILDGLVEVYKNDKMYKFLHVPVQSGSDRILKLMNRKYKSKDFLNIVNRFKQEIPEITLSTDVIVAFPTETDEEFNETTELISEVKPTILNLSKYWALSNTKASLMNQVSVKVAKQRADYVMRQHLMIAEGNHKKLLGREVKVLVNEKKSENLYLSRSGSYNLVVIKSKDPVLGKFLKVTIKKVAPHYVYGEV